MIWHPRPLRFLGFWRGIGRGLLVAALIVALLPVPAGMGRIAFGDKIAHAVAFAFLLLWYAQIYALPRERLRCALALVGFGLSIELLQSLVPYRSADVWDLLADAAGAGLGLLLAHTPLGDLLSRCEPRPAA